MSDAAITQAAQPLAQSLDEENNAGETLSELAQGGIDALAENDGGSRKSSRSRHQTDSRRIDGIREARRAPVGRASRPDRSLNL